MTFVDSIWFEVAVYLAAGSLVLLLWRYNPFIPGRIKNEKLRKFILFLAFVVSLLAVLRSLWI